MDTVGNYYTATLTNGLRALHLHNDSRVAHCGVMIKAGTVDEAPHEQGLAHFLEHVLFKGTQKRKAHQIINRLERVGGDLNAYTGKETTFLYASFLKEHFERAMELLSDIIFHSVFPEKELEKEKDVVIDEIYSYQDTPEEAIYDEFEEKAFARQSIGRNILGTPETVRTFRASDVQDFVDRYYHPGRMVFVSIGAIPKEKLHHLLEKYFAVQKPRSDVKDVRKDTFYTPFYERVKRDTNQSHVIVGAKAYNYSHERRRIFSLINNLLGGSGMTSRLNMSLREKHGYSYQVESNYAPYTGVGLFSVYFGTDRGKVEKSLDLVNRELWKLKNVPLGKQQLQDAKMQMTGQMLISAENKENLLVGLAKRYLLKNQIYDMNRDIQEILQVTADEAGEVARELFTSENLSTLIYE